MWKEYSNLIFWSYTIPPPPARFLLSLHHTHTTPFLGDIRDSIPCQPQAELSEPVPSSQTLKITHSAHMLEVLLLIFGFGNGQISSPQTRLTGVI